MLCSFLVSQLVDTVRNPQEVVGVLDHVAVLEEGVINAFDQLFKGCQCEAAETVQQIVGSVIDHVLDVFFDVHPLLQRLAVALVVVK